MSRHSEAIRLLNVVAAELEEAKAALRRAEARLKQADNRLNAGLRRYYGTLTGKEL